MTFPSIYGIFDEKKDNSEQVIANIKTVGLGEVTLVPWIDEDSVLTSFYSDRLDLKKRTDYARFATHLKIFRLHLESIAAAVKPWPGCIIYTDKYTIPNNFKSIIETNLNDLQSDIVLFSAQSSEPTLDAYWISAEYACECIRRFDKQFRLIGPITDLSIILQGAKLSKYPMRKVPTVNPDLQYKKHLESATHHRHRGENQKSFDCCQQALQIYPCDPAIYYELTIVAYYISQRPIGRQACERLILSHDVPNNFRQEAKKNIMFYMTAFPVERRIQLTFPTPDKYYALNPSIIRLENGYRILCRTTNYIQERGHYTIHDDKQIIRSKPFLLDYTDDFQLKACREVLEDFNSTNRVRYDDKPYRGFEDGRIFYRENNYWFTATSFDSTRHCVGTIALCKLEQLPNTVHETQAPVYIKSVTILSGPDPNRFEKNWLPFSMKDDFAIIYGYNPITIYTYPTMFSGQHKTLTIPHNMMKMSGFKGSAGPVKFSCNDQDGYLIVIHESTQTDRWYYFHRFLWLDNGFAPKKVSQLFHFGHIGVEFCSGIYYDPGSSEAILGVGKEDREAHLYFIKGDEIRNSLKDIDEMIIPQPSMDLIPVFNPKMSDRITFVTCFYDLSKYEERSRGKSVYLEKMKYVLSLQVNLVVYLEQEDHDYVLNIRKEHGLDERTKIVIRPFKQLQKYAYYNTVKNWPRFDNHNPKKDTPCYFVSQNSKWDFVREEIDNPAFPSKFVGWIDIGISHASITEGFNVEKFIDYNVDKIRLTKIRNPNSTDTLDGMLSYYWDNVSSAYLVGSRDIVKKFCEKCEETFQLFMTKGRLFVDGQVVRYIYHHHPDMFDVIIGDYYQQLCNFFSYTVATDFIINLMVEESNVGHHQIAYNAASSMLDNYTDGSLQLSDDFLIKIVKVMLKSGLIVDKTGCQKYRAQIKALGEKSKALHDEIEQTWDNREKVTY